MHFSVRNRHDKLPAQPRPLQLQLHLCNYEIKDHWTPKQNASSQKQKLFETKANILKDKANSEKNGQTVIKLYKKPTKG